MKKFVIVFFVISIFVSLPTYCFAYQDSMIIAGVELRLGMPKDRALDILRKTEYHVGPPSSGEIYVVSQKKGELYDPLGTVGFKNGKVQYISTRWFYTHTNSGSFELAEKIFDLLKQETQNGETIKPTVKVTSIVQPSYKVDTVHMIIDNKTITLSITKGDKEEWGHQIAVFKMIKIK